jgi:uncharacterized protein YfaS (alpha-2-macroglobulin family)
MSNASLSTISPARANSRRFWATVLCFFILNVIAWVVYDRTYAAMHRGTLRVSAFDPGDNAVVDSRATLRWHFSDDVLPTALYGKDPGRTTPPVAGKWAWENPRTLSFIPSGDLPQATPVVFTLATDLLRTGTGAAMKQPFVTCVHCTPLEVEAVRQSAAIEHDQFVLDLKFNDRVSPADVLQHMSATLPNGTHVNCHLYGQSAGKTVRVMTDPVPMESNDAEVYLNVKLSPGLTGFSGPLGLADPYQTSFGLGKRVMATQMTAYSPTRGTPYLMLSFNSEIDLPALKKVLTIEPAVPFALESNGGNSAVLRGEFASGTRYTAHIAALPAGATRAEKMKTPRPGQLAAYMPDKGSEVWFDNDQGYLSTAGNRTIVAHAMNVSAVRVSITRMYDNNLVAWRNSNDGAQKYNTEAYSKPISHKTLKVPAGKNIRRDLPICLDDFIPASEQTAGVWRVGIAPDSIAPDSIDTNTTAGDSNQDSDDDRSSAVVTLSDIGLTAKQTRQGLVAWATSLRTASPLAGVRIRAFSSKNQLLGEGVTDAEGIARLKDIHPARDEIVSVLLADKSTESAVGGTRTWNVGRWVFNLIPTSNAQVNNQTQLTWLDLRHTNWELGDSDTSGAAYLRSGQSAYVYTDRGIYRPGETVHLRAILRSPGQIAPRTAFPVKWQLRRPDLRDWKSQTVMLDADGAAALDVALPTDLPSGQWTANIGLPGEDKKSTATFGTVTFLVEDFIPNRLKVGMSLSCGNEKEPRRYAISETPLDVEIQGDYLFGRPGAGLAVDLTNRAVPTPFCPTGWDGWSFGDTATIATVAKPAETEPRPTKSKRHKKTVPANNIALVSDEQQPETSVLDEHGRYRSSLSVADIVHLPDDPSPDQYHGPWLLSTSAGVHEAGGRAVTVGKQIAVDALPAYIGVRRVDAETNAKPGEPSDFQVKLVKPDGSPANQTNGIVQMQLLKQTWNTTLTFRDGRYHYDSTRVLDLIKSESVQIHEGGGIFGFDVPTSGLFVIRLVQASTGAMTSLSFYATDGSGWDENVDRQNPEHLDVRILGVGESADATDTKKPEHSTWHERDTARVLVSSPFKGRLLLSVETDEVVQTQVIDMTASHVVVPVKVTDACWPNAYISATVIRPIDPDAKWKTHRAFGVTHLNVDSSDRRLQMTLQTPELIRPLQSLDVAVKVTDPDGKPVAGAAVNFAAVDEGICSLTDFKTPDPLKFFSAKRALGVLSGDVFGLLMPEVAKPDGQRAIGGDKTESASGSRYRSPVGARRVKPVALAWATAHSDADGIARASFPIPQFEGRLRVIAVGYTSRLLGSVDRGVTVRSPILAQSSWPRFAAPGDQFTVPVVLFNNTNSGGDATVSMHLMNDERTPPGLLAFKGKLPTVAMAAGGQAQVNLNVAVAQAVGVAKVRLHVAMGDESYDEEVELPVRPASPLTQFGGMLAASTTQPTTLAAMTNLMPGTDSLRVSLTPWPTLNLPQGLDYLDRYPYGCVEQTTSTCFPLIALGDIGKQIDPARFDPDRIKAKIDAGILHLIGMQTAEGGLAMWSGGSQPWPWASAYAAHFITEARAAGYDVPPEFYDRLLSYLHHLIDHGTDNPVELETQAYASYVLALAGKPDRAVLDRLTELSSMKERPDDPIDGYAMRGDARLMLSCAWLLSGRRDLAESLMPAAIPIPRQNRQWDGNIGSPIRDRVMLILAMEQVDPRRAELPQLVQQLADQGIHRQWSSTQDVAFSLLAIGRYLRDQQHHTSYDSARLLLGKTPVAEARSGSTFAWTADADQLRSQQPIVLELTGATDAIGHLSWLQTGVPLTPPADAEHGLKIHRKYLSLDGKELAGTVRTGDLVRVELTIEGPANQSNLVIEDLLPAGLEVENPRLETAAKLDDDSENRQATFGNGRVDMLDDRVIIAGHMPGVAKAHCSYLARAITPGVYTVPPVRCEAMYDLNTNALSGSGKLTVLPVVKDMAAAE